MGKSLIHLIYIYDGFCGENPNEWRGSGLTFPFFSVLLFLQFREFGDTFAVLGLNPAYVGTAYGLAEHVVGVCAHEANLAGHHLSTFSDQDLECVGEVDKLSEGSQVCMYSLY